MRPTTKFLITLIAGFYLVDLIYPISNYLYLNKLLVLENGEWWRIGTVALVHAGIFHLGFNLYALMVLGNPLEDMLGQRKFLVLFLVSLIGGSLASMFFNPSNVNAVGVSGAIFGLFGALVMLSNRYGIDNRPMYTVIGINLAIGFIFPGIDWRAHVGGLIAGALVTKFFLTPTRG